MKRLFLLAIFAAVLAISFNGCTNSSDVPASETPEVLIGDGDGDGSNEEVSLDELVQILEDSGVTAYAVDEDEALTVCDVMEKDSESLLAFQSVDNCILYVHDPDDPEAMEEIRIVFEAEVNEEGVWIIPTTTEDGDVIDKEHQIASFDSIDKSAEVTEYDVIARKARECLEHKKGECVSSTQSSLEYCNRTCVCHRTFAISTCKSNAKRIDYNSYKKADCKGNATKKKIKTEVCVNPW